jgi:hypothetical protein
MLRTGLLHPHLLDIRSERADVFTCLTEYPERKCALGCHMKAQASLVMILMYEPGPLMVTQEITSCLSVSGF